MGIQECASLNQRNEQRGEVQGYNCEIRGMVVVVEEEEVKPCFGPPTLAE